MLIAGPNSTAGSAGNVLAIVAGASFKELEAELAKVGYAATCVDSPYAALAELLDRPLVYRALVVSLPALYREELTVIRTVRSRLPHVDVLLAHTDGRHAALAEAMRLGATGLLSDEAVHRLADIDPSPAAMEAMATEKAFAEPTDTPEPQTTNRHPPEEEDASADVEPLLTADELRMLLSDQGGTS